MAKRKSIVIGITGKAGSGKTHMAEYLRNYDWLNARVVSLADPLKIIAKKTLGFTNEQLWGPSELRSQPHPITGVVPRVALQTLGDWGRNLHPDVWVAACLHTIAEQEQGPVYLFLIPDVRFKNEVHALRNYGATLVRIKRDVSAEIGGISGHASEAEQDSIPDEAFDHIINNNGNVDAFNDRIDQIASELKLERQGYVGTNFLTAVVPGEPDKVKVFKNHEEYAQFHEEEKAKLRGDSN